MGSAAPVFSGFRKKIYSMRTVRNRVNVEKMVFLIKSDNISIHFI